MSTSPSRPVRDVGGQIEWTDRMERVIRDNYHEKSLGALRQLLPGVSRGALAGKIRRMGLQSGRTVKNFQAPPEVVAERHRQAGEASAQRAREAKLTAERARVAQMLGKSHRKAEPPPVVAPVATIPPPRDCQWPLNDRRPWSFCGAKREKGPYCAKHWALGHTGSTTW